MGYLQRVLDAKRALNEADDRLAEHCEAAYEANGRQPMAETDEYNHLNGLANDAKGALSRAILGK